MAISTFFFVFINILLTIAIAIDSSAAPKFPAIFVFGDSLLDSGNNNFILTVFQANHFPYGKDFPGRIPTGRFSNGKLMPDLIASTFGIKDSVPPFLSPNLSDDDVRTGVNFASAGSGYDDVTTLLSRVIPVSMQLEYFKQYRDRLKKLVGDEEAAKIVGGALVLIAAGSNDFAISFYNSASRRLQYSIGGYQDFILQRLQNVLEVLYGLGCRTIIVTGLPPIGCAPAEIVTRFQGPFRGCLEDQDSDSQDYNKKLVNLLPQIQAKLVGSKLLYGDIYTTFKDMVDNPQQYGFVETKRGCCGSGIVEAGPTCSPVTPTCQNASAFLFFDSIHPSQSAYQYIWQYIYKDILPQLT